jgi:putative FmdB family regulatory protein
MPFYEYQCKNCGHQLEAMQKVSDSPLKKCPDCGKSQLQRLMSAPVFRLKGGGWYETDFKGDQDHKRNLADRPETEASKEDSVKADAKTDAKAGDTKGAETKPGESKTADAGAGDGPTPKEKPSVKPVEKAAVRSSKPAAKRTATKRVSRPAKKSPAKAKRRR